MDYIPRTPEQLGALLRSSRKARHLSQAQISDQVGQKQNMISRMEIDTSTRTIGTLYRVLSALGLELVIRDEQTDPDPRHDTREW